ncbi:MAG: error-prone DNA polymerase [Acidobacteria bacterium]|nr:error-prone DNA polymerase [Acidobacteriota bacterium]
MVHRCHRRLNRQTSGERAVASSSYVELHTASAFSFLRGASLPEALVDRAAALGYRALALVDRGGVYGAPRFHKAARAAGIRPIIGAELILPQATLPLLCETQEGYRNLCRLITRMKLAAPAGLRQDEGGSPEDRRRRKAGGVLALDDLDGCTRGLVALVDRQALDARRHGVGGLLDRLVGLFGRDRVFVEVQRHFRRDEEADNRALIDLAAAFRVPVIATGGVRFATPAERPLHDVLACIRHGTMIAEAGRRLAPNAERYLKPPAEAAALFADLPDAVARTGELADRLQYTMADLGYRFPDYPVPAGETQASFLRQIADLGARDRYRPYHDRARAQIARELDLIERLDLAGYFLIVWDIVNFCRGRGILVQGRGSAANSAVCYSLGITAVDPVGMDLLFERFLSEERGEWPDIDLDLPSGDRREQVIQHVYGKYGRLGAAMTASVITYRGRSAAREAGKALGFDPAQVDRLAKAMDDFDFVDRAGLPAGAGPPRPAAEGGTLPRRLASAGLDVQSEHVRRFARIWEQMLDLPRHLGQHSGGMVICQGQLDAVVPLEPACMPGRVVVQWDKDDCADMGIVKVDLLGLGMMAVLQDAIALVPNLDLARLPPDDPAVYRMLQEADTIGVFQVESRAQMATLPRLAPERFYDLVVQVAIIRPGPIVGQMVHPYLNRRAGREPVVYPHPSLEPILKRTLGVPLFQEQLLRMAMVAAGFTGGQAEALRRAMGFKRSAQRMQQIELQLRAGMAANGIVGAPAEQIIASIASFALYGFPESHAASFALLAYASAYLKAHYPAAFYTALLNNQPMGFYHPATLVKDAQRRGVRFLPIDVQTSDWDCSVAGDGAIRLGLRYVSGLRQEAGRRIALAPTADLKVRTTTEGTGLKARAAAETVQASRPAVICPKCGCDDDSMIERSDDGRAFCNTCSYDWAGEAGKAGGARFASIDDLVARAGLRRSEVVTLADLGALNTFGYDRRSALWQAERAVRPAGELLRAGEIASDCCPLAPMTEAERAIADYAGMGLTVGRHPMALRREELAMRGILRASDLRAVRHGRRVRVAGMVITRQRPGTARGFVFLTLEDETGIANIIVRPDLFARDRLVFVEEPFLIVDGIMQAQDGVFSVRAEQVQALQGASVNFDAHDFY